MISNWNLNKNRLKNPLIIVEIFLKEKVLLYKQNQKDLFNLEVNNISEHMKN